MTTPKSKLPLKLISFILCLALFAPVPAHAGLGDLFAAIDSTISDLIGGTLTLITTVQTNIRSLYEEVVWPIGVINSTRTWSRNLVGQYRGWMSLVYHLPIQSAQTMSPQKLEDTILSGRVGQLGQLAPAYNSTYGALPTDQQAPLDLRQMMDMNDSLAQDALKQTVASDQANESLLKMADDMENNATLAPGTSSYVSASAYAATLQTLAYQHKLLAAQLREEGAHLAHQSADMKRDTQRTNDLHQSIFNMLSTR
jgi:hypothetical protein